MKKGKITMKASIGYNEIIEMVENIVSGFFQDELDDDGMPTGRTLYTPYFKDQMLSALFVQYAVEGIEFDKDENPYLSIVDNPDLMDIYAKWKARNASNPKKSQLYAQMIQVEKLVEDKLEVEKQKYIHESGMNYEVKSVLRALSSLLDYQAEALEQQNEFNRIMPVEDQAAFAQKISQIDCNGAEIAREITKAFLQAEKDSDKK